MRQLYVDTLQTCWNSMTKNKKVNIDELIAEAESTKIQELKADNLKLLKQVDKLKNKKADFTI